MSFEAYKKRLEANGGSIIGSITESTINSINTSFKDFPDFKVVYINGISYDSRIAEGESPQEKTLLFRPKTTVKNGNIVLINSKNWLVTDFYENEIYPKADVVLCNNVLKIVTSTVETINGHDHLGRPIISKVDTFTDFPCIVEVAEATINEDSQIVTSDGSLRIIVNYNSRFVEGLRFEMYGKTYRVINVDSTKVISNIGIVTLFCNKEN